MSNIRVYKTREKFNQQQQKRETKTVDDYKTVKKKYYYFWTIYVHYFRYDILSQQLRVVDKP